MQIRKPLKSPNADEYAVGTSRQLGQPRHAARRRRVPRAITTSTASAPTSTTGKVTDDLGNVYDLFLVENTERREAPLFGPDDAGQLSLRRAASTSAATTRCRARGATSTARRARAGPIGRAGQRYPEYKRADVELAGRRSGCRPASSRAAVGDLLRRRCRDGAGSLTFGLLQQVGSGVPYGAVGTGSSGIKPRRS